MEVESALVLVVLVRVTVIMVATVTVPCMVSPTLSGRLARVSEEGHDARRGIPLRKQD